MSGAGEGLRVPGACGAAPQVPGARQRVLLEFEELCHFVHSLAHSFVRSFVRLFVDGSYSTVQADLELTTGLMTPSHLQPCSSLSSLSAGITGMSPHAQLRTCTSM